ncbi:hypothetical protein MTO96_008587 [Rhipicephalus appendiculatus]
MCEDDGRRDADFEAVTRSPQLLALRNAEADARGADASVGLVFSHNSLNPSRHLRVLKLARWPGKLWRGLMDVNDGLEYLSQRLNTGSDSENGEYRSLSLEY